MITTLILSLYYMGLTPVKTAAISLFMTGIALLIAEVALVSLGLLSLNGLIALYAAYSLSMGSGTIFGLDIGLQLIMGIAFVEALIILTSLIIYKKFKNMKNTTGIEAMIGQPATIIAWHNNTGTVMFEGEIWQAKTQSDTALHKDDIVTIHSVNKMTLNIEKHS